MVFCKNNEKKYQYIMSYLSLNYLYKKNMYFVSFYFSLKKLIRKIKVFNIEFIFTNKKIKIYRISLL